MWFANEQAMNVDIIRRQSGDDVKEIVVSFAPTDASRQRDDIFIPEMRVLFSPLGQPGRVWPEILVIFITGHTAVDHADFVFINVRITMQYIFPYIFRDGNNP